MSKSHVVFILVALAVVSLIAGPVLAQEALWTYMTGYDPEHTGVSPDDLQLPLSLNFKYTVELEEKFNAVAGAAVGPERVYFPANETIYAVDRMTGAEEWSLKIGAKIYSAPLLHNGVLYFGADNSNLYAVDAKTGNRLSALKAGGAIKTTPMYVAGILYFTADDHRVYAVDPDPKSLRLYWQYQTGDKVRAAASYYRGTIYVSSTDSFLYAIRDGGQAWRVQLPSDNNFAAPIIERRKVIVASGNKLIACDTRSGARRWTFSAGSLISGTPAADRRRVFVGSHDGVLYCLSSSDGRILWRFPRNETREPLSSSLSVAGDVVIARSGDTDVFALNVEDGSLAWEYRLPEPAETASMDEDSRRRDRRGRDGRGEPGIPGEMEPGMDMPEGPEMGIPGEEGPGGRRGRRGEEVREIEYEEVVTPGASLTEDGAYIVAVDGSLYGFSSMAADNVKPQISAALLDVPGRNDVRARFPLVVDGGDAFPGRYADLVEVPGAPPLRISVKVVDSGSGINPDGFAVQMNEETVSVTYDAASGLLWYEYDPSGAASSLRNGVKNLVITATDWAGNSKTAQVSFTVDNSLEPPGPARRERQGPEGMEPTGPWDEMMPPGEEMPPMP